jgi:hypothetical protein
VNKGIFLSGTYLIPGKVKDGREQHTGEDELNPDRLIYGRANGLLLPEQLFSQGRMGSPFNQIPQCR